MAIQLTEAQQHEVETRRKPAGSRPQYFSASAATKVRISADFEAFLILQGQPNNAQTLQWLQQCNDFAVSDADRDSLLATHIQNELDDAIASGAELFPVFDAFNQFKAKFNLDGFQQVPECGQLLADLQRPMAELQVLGGRHQHRQVYANLLLEQLKDGGVTDTYRKELNSWSGPLTAY